MSSLTETGKYPCDVCCKIVGFNWIFVDTVSLAFTKDAQISISLIIAVDLKCQHSLAIAPFLGKSLSRCIVLDSVFRNWSCWQVLLPRWYDHVSWRLWSSHHPKWRVWWKLRNFCHCCHQIAFLCQHLERSLHFMFQVLFFF